MSKLFSDKINHNKIYNKLKKSNVPFYSLGLHVFILLGK
jgi:hypothetical protein